MQMVPLKLHSIGAVVGCRGGGGLEGSGNWIET